MANVHAFNGRCGDCLLAKVGKVLLELRTQMPLRPDSEPYAFFRYEQLKRFVVARRATA